MKRPTSSLDPIINTVPVKHDLNPYLSLFGRRRIARSDVRYRFVIDMRTLELESV